MLKYLLLSALLFSALITFAQKATIQGKLVDSLNNSPIEFATVAVLTVKDTTSTLLVYTVTDKDGLFALHNLPTGVNLKILISTMAYKPFRKTMTLNKGETLDFSTLRLEPKVLNEVVIKGERPPVVMNKDTIEFNAEAFKTRPNAVVEELLKKLPGMEVTMDGTISFNGKNITQILINGNAFFGSNYRIATKNLDAEIIDKVQVYDDRQNDPDHLIPESQVAKIINLKLKGAYKKSIFGKFYGGKGTEGRYSAGGIVNMFRDTLQVSILNIENNLNNTGFSFDDLYRQGGINRGGGAALLRGGFSPFGGVNQGIENVLSTGININTDYGKKLKINVAYGYEHQHIDISGINNRQQMTNDTDFTTNTVNTGLRLNTSHNLSATVLWKPSTATQLNYSPSVSFHNNQSTNTSTASSYSDFIPKIAVTNNNDHNSDISTAFQQSLNYNHQFAKQGRSIDISHNLSISPDNGNDNSIDNLTSYTTNLSSFLLNRNANTNNRSTDASLTVSYRNPFSKKLSGNIAVSDDYHHQVNNTITYDFDPVTNLYDSFLQTLSTNLTRNLQTENITPGFTYNMKQGVQLVVNAHTQVLAVNNKFDRNIADINQRFVNVLPSVELNWDKVSIGYRSEFRLPNIGDMIPYTVVGSPLYSVTGNRNLKPSKSENYSIRYSSFSSESQFNINASAAAAFDQNDVFRQNTINAVGGTTSTPINMDGAYRLSSSVGLGKRFKKQNGFGLRLNTNLTASKNRGFFEINGQNGFQNTVNLGLNQEFAFDYKDAVQLEQSYNFNNSNTTYSGVNYNPVNNFAHTLNTHLIVFAPQKLIIESTYNFTYRPLVSPGFQKSSSLLNLSIARQLLKKDRGEIKLSCYDLLNQNISSSRFVSANTITDSQAQILRRYVLLTFQYKFTKSMIKK